MVLVDRVYQTVLTLLNKEQRGFLPPTEFNQLANQAQIELFEEYFGDQARAMQNPMMDSDYADMVRNLEEKITFFDNTSAPITENASDVWEYPDDFYRLGRVILNNVIVDEVSHRDVMYINLSPLTAPTRTQPVYVRHEGGIVVYPTTMLDTDEVRMIYVRTPRDVVWAGGMSPAGQTVCNSAGSTNFELHPSELPELIAKILGYAGVTVKAPDVAQAAQGLQTTITQNEQ